jgi:hypothetical protein
MRIRRIKLTNFGGVEESEVTFPADGITVIEGENEAGKSSLLQALDAIVEYKDNSSSRKIKDLVPVGRDVGPQVEIEVETGEYAFTYRKRWHRDRETVLETTRPTREQLSGRDAHDRVVQILDDTLDADLWKALRLDQGTALEQASFEGSAIGRALDAASGGDVAGDHEDALWDRVEGEYARYWTRTAKPREDLASARRELTKAREAAEAARAHVRSLDENVAEIERLTSRAETLEEAAVEANRAVSELQAQADEIKKIRQSLKAAVSESDRSTAALAAARSERERRFEQVDHLGATEGALADIESEVAGVEPEREILAAAVEDADTNASTARSAFEEARRNHERARRDAEFRRWEIEVAQFRGRRNRIEEAKEELSTASALLDDIRVDKELLEEIEEAYLRVVEFRAAVDRALPVVRVEAIQETAVVIDGEEIALATGDTREVAAHGRTEVIVPGVIGFSVTTGTDGADVVEELKLAEAALATVCVRGGVQGFEEARREFDRRGEADRTRSSANETINRDQADLTFDEIVHKFESLTRRIHEYIDTRGDDSPIPSDHSLAQDTETAEEQTLDVAREASEQASQLATLARERLNELEKTTAGRLGKLEIQRNAVASARSLLEAARTERSDEDIENVESEARKALEDARALVADLEGQLRGLDAETVDALLDNALGRRERSRTDLSGVTDRRTELQIRLAFETERGPARLVDEAETRLVEAERGHEAIERRAAAAANLREVFATHRDAARRRYIQPFRDEIERLGRIVYGSSFEVGLDEDLSIDTRTLDGDTLRFGQLSTGAQEQLGVLSRLACARLVSDDGGAPVVLDDALGWTDPERLDAMGAAISSAADDCQVIILTCVPERYAAVGKARTVRI